MDGRSIEAFDTTYQKTNIWFNEIMDELAWEDRHRAYLALRAVLHALRDRLPVEEAAHLGAQLPMLVRGLYYEGWSPAGKPEKIRKKEEFLDKVGRFFGQDPDLDFAEICQAVFHVLERHISPGEIQKIKHDLPKDFLEFWEPPAAT